MLPPIEIEQLKAMWDNDAPACDDGLLLLRAWLGTLPPVMDIPRLVSLALTGDVLESTSEWNAFLQHIALCLKCESL